MWASLPCAIHQRFHERKAGFYLSACALYFFPFQLWPLRPPSGGHAAHTPQIGYLSRKSCKSLLCYGQNAAPFDGVALWMAGQAGLEPTTARFGDVRTRSEVYQTELQAIA